MNSICEIFGSSVFNDRVMQQRLPKETYKALKKIIYDGTELSLDVAQVVASVMKDWALEKGATHFTHWFQPLTGITAEKHDSFISSSGDGETIVEFSGKELIMGEPDASSFPSGGLRVTFEARGYTAWDCTSPAFIKDDTLCIPTAFCSYGGEALDKKTPLLRSMEVISTQALRVLKLLGNTTTNKVITTVGPEQEYFLIDKKMYDLRKDLIYTGRTLFGARPPKGQEMDDHYFTGLTKRVIKYMQDLDQELWKLGIYSKTRHNEVAPAQHEMAPIFLTTNISTDHNQLVMEMMQKVALRHGLVCLLHEKPFAGINGSGKHNNWSMSTDDGQNLLEPGKTPHDNAQFLVILGAVIKAVDEYADLLRLSAANPGNDHRLGANEAPPAIVSMFLGDQLTDILEQLENGKPSSSKSGGKLRIGVCTLPSLPKDSTDRNRTSPFAFTGNKFEFRMVPSSGSISDANYVLNTIVAETLSQIAEQLESAKNVETEIQVILSNIVKKHKRIVFNGNNYSSDWVDEAKKRGLPNITSMVEACEALKSKKNIDVLTKHKVLSATEIESRYEIFLETYAKTINIEALTSIDMANRQILPACMSYASEIASSINTITSAAPKMDVSAQISTLEDVTSLSSKMKKSIITLQKSVDTALKMESDIAAQAKFYRDDVFVKMNKLRSYADALELIVDEEFWPIPVYGDILFNV